jgi:uncharacterized protein (DUF362 family)/Pyruvate/2-oxoacid:ferredoxin oxidoreductase delta subunit
MKRNKHDSNGSARVALEHCGSYDPDKVFKAVDKAIDELGGMSRFVKRGNKVLLKPNLLISRAADKHVTTHPDVVRAVVRLVKKAGGKPLIGDSPALGSAERVASKCGIADVALEEKAEIVNFNRPEDVDNPDGVMFKKYKIDRAVVEADVVINLPKLKTHGQMTLTLGVKNTFGVIPGTRKSQWHLAAGTDRMHFARMLVDLHRKVAPALTVMDAVIGMHGNGPQNGDLKRIGLIMASSDSVALDAVACEVVGLKRERMLTALAAEEMGVGETRLSHISVAGESIDGSRVAGFEFPKVIDVMNLFPGVLREPLRDWLTTRPVLNKKKCEGCLICMKNCPAQVIEPKNDIVQFNLKKCIRCFCCQEMCPQGAIRIGTGPLARILRL